MRTLKRLYSQMNRAWVLPSCTTPGPTIITPGESHPSITHVAKKRFKPPRRTSTWARLQGPKRRCCDATGGCTPTELVQRSCCNALAFVRLSFMASPIPLPCPCYLCGHGCRSGLLSSPQRGPPALKHMLPEVRSDTLGTQAYPPFAGRGRSAILVTRNNVHISRWWMASLHRRAAKSAPWVLGVCPPWKPAFLIFFASTLPG